MPHGAGADIADDAPDGVLTANTESCLSSSVLAHFGHSSLVEALTSNSKRWLHSRHAYSKSGMSDDTAVCYT